MASHMGWLRHNGRRPPIPESEARDSFGGLPLCITVRARRTREAAGRAIALFHLIFPRQPVTAGDEIAHIGVRTILRAAGNGRITAMPELVNIVFDAPMDARFAHEIGAHFRSDDLIGEAARPMREHAAVE